MNLLYLHHRSPYADLNLFSMLRSVCVCFCLKPNNKPSTPKGLKKARIHEESDEMNSTIQ